MGQGVTLDGKTASSWMIFFPCHFQCSVVWVLTGLDQKFKTLVCTQMLHLEKSLLCQWHEHSSCANTLAVCSSMCLPSSAAKVSRLKHWSCWAQITVSFSGPACWSHPFKETSRASLVSSHVKPTSLSLWTFGCCLSHDTFWKYQKENMRL